MQQFNTQTSLMIEIFVLSTQAVIYRNSRMFPKVDLLALFVNT